MISSGPRVVESPPDDADLANVRRKARACLRACAVLAGNQIAGPLRAERSTRLTRASKYLSITSSLPCR